MGENGSGGKCVPGDAFNASMCSQKLIGCQSYVEGFGAGNVDTDPATREFLSCRDSDSHGTHTATTAAGNFGVPFGTSERGPEILPPRPLDEPESE